MCDILKSYLTSGNTINVHRTANRQFLLQCALCDFGRFLLMHSFDLN